MANVKLRIVVEALNQLLSGVQRLQPVKSMVGKRTADRAKPELLSCSIVSVFIFSSECGIKDYYWLGQNRT